MKPIRISISVTTGDPGVVTRAIESMSRCAAGLALEETDVWMSVTVDEDSEADV
jgi:hypothetical protein